MRVRIADLQKIFSLKRDVSVRQSVSKSATRIQDDFATLHIFMMRMTIVIIRWLVRNWIVTDDDTRDDVSIHICPRCVSYYSLLPSFYS